MGRGGARTGSGRTDVARGGAELGCGRAEMPSRSAAAGAAGSVTRGGGATGGGGAKAGGAATRAGGGALRVRGSGIRRVRSLSGAASREGGAETACVVSSSRTSVEGSEILSAGDGSTARSCGFATQAGTPEVSSAFGTVSSARGGWALHGAPGMSRPPRDEAPGAAIGNGAMGFAKLPFEKGRPDPPRANGEVAVTVAPRGWSLGDTVRALHGEGNGAFGPLLAESSLGGAVRTLRGGG